jgi:hypothetical protein
MNVLLFTITMIITNILLLLPITKIISLDKLDGDFLFIYLSNIILLFGLFIFLILKISPIFSFFTSLFQMIFAFLLIYNIKNILGKYNILSIPYFFYSVYIFSKIFTLYFF